jgi:hypothetical protein
VQYAFYALYINTNMEWLDHVYGAIYGCDSLNAGGAYTVYLNGTHPQWAAMYEELGY